MSYVLIFIFSKNISSIFTKSGDFDLINITSNGMRLYFIGCIFMSFNIVTIYFFQSINQSLKSMIISLCSTIVFIVLGFLILVPKLNVTGVWLVFPFAEILGFLVCLIVLYKNTIKNKKELI